MITLLYLFYCQCKADVEGKMPLAKEHNTFEELQNLISTSNEDINNEKMEGGSHYSLNYKNIITSEELVKMQIFGEKMEDSGIRVLTE